MAEQRTSRMVKNKDITLLQEIRLIELDIVSLEKRAQWERDRMSSITQHLSSGGGGGSPSGLDEAFAAISETEERHRKLIGQYAKVVNKAERIIGRIASHQMRTMVRMLYVDNVADIAVQSVLRMSRRMFENARATIESAECMADVKWNDKYATDD